MTELHNLIQMCVCTLFVNDRNMWMKSAAAMSMSQFDSSFPCFWKVFTVLLIAALKQDQVISADFAFFFMKIYLCSFLLCAKSAAVITLIH